MFYKRKGKQIFDSFNDNDNSLLLDGEANDFECHYI